MDDVEQGLPYGRARDGRLLSVGDVPSGLACDCVCPGCERRLVAKKGAIIAHHFAHEAGSDCASGYETMAHLLAKQIIAETKWLDLPELIARHDDLTTIVRPVTRIEFDRVEVEAWRDGIRPDLIGHVNGRELAIEIFVRHRCDPDKIAIFNGRAMAALEIDLSRAPSAFHAETFKAAVLTTAPRLWLFNGLLEPALEQLKAEARERERAARLALEARIEAETRAEELRQKIREQEALYAEGLRRQQEALEAERAAREAKEQAIWAERQRLIYLEENRRQQEELERERGAIAARMETFIEDLRPDAIKLLGDNVGAAFMGSIRLPAIWKHGPLRVANFHEFEQYWRDSLMSAFTRRAEQQAEATRRREELEREASRSFRSLELAAVWMKSGHPKLNRSRPFDVCVDADGFARCKALLK